MKKLKVYIDFAGDGDFADSIKERFLRIDGISQALSYNDIEPSNTEDWEKITVNALKEADIVVPILSEEYLGYVSGKIEKQFEEIISSSDRYLFPIWNLPSEWGAFKWVVKSNIIPNDGKPLSEHNDSDKKKILNGLIRTIKDILHRVNTPVTQNQDDGLKGENKQNVIFISHDHDDADFAELLKLKLEKSGLNGWIDSERLKIGQDWREEIDLGIKNSLAVIAIMTPEARKSEYVTYEWAYAWGKGKKVFPLLLKQTQLHPRLESLQYLDFTNRASRPWEELISSIKEIIK